MSDQTITYGDAANSTPAKPSQPRVRRNPEERVDDRYSWPCGLDVMVNGTKLEVVIFEARLQTGDGPNNRVIPTIEDAGDPLLSLDHQLDDQPTVLLPYEDDNHVFISIRGRYAIKLEGTATAWDNGAFRQTVPYLFECEEIFITIHDTATLDDEEFNYTDPTAQKVKYIYIGLVQRGESVTPLVESYLRSDIWPTFPVEYVPVSISVPTPIVKLSDELVFVSDTTTCMTFRLDQRERTFVRGPGNVLNDITERMIERNDRTYVFAKCMDNEQILTLAEFNTETTDCCELQLVPYTVKGAVTFVRGDGQLRNFKLCGSGEPELPSTLEVSTTATGTSNEVIAAQYAVGLYDRVLPDPAGVKTWQHRTKPNNKIARDGTYPADADWSLLSNPPASAAETFYNTNPDVAGTEVEGTYEWRDLFGAYGAPTLTVTEA